MGCYYRIINHIRRERIEPRRMGGGSIKWDVTRPGHPCAVLLAWLEQTDITPWHFVGDDTEQGDDYYLAGREYRDATAETVTRYNEAHPRNPLVLRPPDEGES